MIRQTANRILKQKFAWHISAQDTSNNDVYYNIISAFKRSLGENMLLIDYFIT